MILDRKCILMFDLEGKGITLIPDKLSINIGVRLLDGLTHSNELSENWTAKLNKARTIYVSSF